MIKKLFLSATLVCSSVLLSTACAQSNHSDVSLTEEKKENSDEGFIEADESFNFTVISDLNRSYGSTTYSKDVDTAINSMISKKGTSEEASLVLSTGDMVAGQKQGLNYKAMWAAFHEKVTTKLNKAGIAFAPSPGNHDASVGS